MRKARLLYWQSSSILSSATKIVLAEFQIAVSGEILESDEVIDFPISTSDHLIDWVRKTRNFDTSLYVLLCPVKLQTAFGHAIAGECREGVILISSSSVISPALLPRVLRHEIGHYFGLSEHLDCVMSPYYTQVTHFCDSCLVALERQGIGWQNRELSRWLT